LVSSDKSQDQVNPIISIKLTLPVMEEMTLPTRSLSTPGNWNCGALLILTAGEEEVRKIFRVKTRIVVNLIIFQLSTDSCQVKLQ